LLLRDVEAHGVMVKVVVVKGRLDTPLLLSSLLLLLK